MGGSRESIREAGQRERARKNRRICDSRAAAWHNVLLVLAQRLGYTLVIRKPAKLHPRETLPRVPCIRVVENGTVHYDMSQSVGDFNARDAGAAVPRGGCLEPGAAAARAGNSGAPRRDKCPRPGGRRVWECCPAGRVCPCGEASRGCPVRRVQCAGRRERHPGFRRGVRGVHPAQQAVRRETAHVAAWLVNKTVFEPVFA